MQDCLEGVHPSKFGPYISHEVWSFIPKVGRTFDKLDFIIHPLAKKIEPPKPTLAMLLQIRIARAQRWIFHPKVLFVQPGTERNEVDPKWRIEIN